MRDGIVYACLRDGIEFVCVLSKFTLSMFSDLAVPCGSRYSCLLTNANSDVLQYSSRQLFISSRNACNLHGPLGTYEHMDPTAIKECTANQPGQLECTAFKGSGQKLVGEVGHAVLKDSRTKSFLNSVRLCVPHTWFHSSALQCVSSFWSGGGYRVIGTVD